MKRLLVLSVALALFFPTIRAQSLGKGNFEVKRNAVTGNYNFWVYTPGDYDGQHPLPLIIFLHGASLCGHDLNKVRRYGVLDAIEKGKVVPALVLAPQNPGGAAWNPEKLDGLLQWMEQNYVVDSTRIYVLGMSLGGYGTMDFVGSYPQKIAAAMALCGGCDLKNLDGLGQLPLWIIHGTADRAVPMSASKRVVDYLHENKTDSLLRYDWWKGATHGTPARLFYLQKTYDWLFSHSTRDIPREVDRSFDITQEDLKQTYDELKWFNGMFDDD